MIHNTTKPKTTSVFPLQKLKGNQPVSEMATMHLLHLEEESAKREEEDKTGDPDYQQGYGRVYGAPGTGCEGHTSGGEALLPLQQP